MHSRYRISHHAAGPEPRRVDQGVHHPGHVHAVCSVIAVNSSRLASLTPPQSERQEATAARSPAISAVGIKVKYGRNGHSRF